MFQSKVQSSRHHCKIATQTLWHPYMSFAQKAQLSLLRPDAGDMVEKLQACLLQARERSFIISSQRQHKTKESSWTMGTNLFRSFCPFSRMCEFNLWVESSLMQATECGVHDLELTRKLSGLITQITYPVP